MTSVRAQHRPRSRITCDPRDVIVGARQAYARVTPHRRVAGRRRSYPIPAEGFSWQDRSAGGRHRLTRSGKAAATGGFRFAPRVLQSLGDRHSQGPGG